jgi:TPR repeat protein
MKACLTALFLGVACFLFQAGAAEPTAAEQKQFLETKAKAEQGDAKAQFELGNIYGNGKGMDRSEAGKWYLKAAEQGHAGAQRSLGFYFKLGGGGVEKDAAEAVRWYLKAAEQGDAEAGYDLGMAYLSGGGVAKDATEAAKWLRKVAERGHGFAQFQLGAMYNKGDGVVKDAAEAVEWFRKSAEQGNDFGQYGLWLMYTNGDGVVKDYVEAYKWLLLSRAQGNPMAKSFLTNFERHLTANQREEGQRLAREWKPVKAIAEGKPNTTKEVAASKPSGSGTGFFITDDGYFITNQHVAGEGATVRLVTAAGSVAAKVVKVDKANDVALLKAEGKFTALPVITSRGVRLGSTAATVGFPNIGLQGFAPKLARGEIASLAGAQDDARHFQISAPIQPGNSGGALVDERGNVIGVVVAKLSQRAALATSGALAENVNYAVKSSYLLSFLESVPEVAAKLKDAHTKDRKFEDVVKSVEQAAVLVLVY